MERDFLGLSSKNDTEEALDDSKNQASLRGSSMQWPFSNKVAVVPHLLSFKAAEDDRVRKTVVDPLTSTGFMAWPASNSFYSFQKPFCGSFQGNGIIDSKAGSQYAMTVFPLEKLEAHSIDRSNIHSQLISNIRQQPQGVSFAGPFIGHPLPSSSLKTIFRNPSKTSVSPQLTIFYGGSVSVYDDISPESAQAIMLLAANGSTKSENNTSFTPRMQVQSQCHTLGRPDLLHPNFCQLTKEGGSCCANGLTAIKPSGTLGSLNPSLEAIKPGSPVRCSPPYVVSSAVPQARKASLARFLEKRKERKLHASPYNFPESECSNYMIDRSGTDPLPALT